MKFPVVLLSCVFLTGCIMVVPVPQPKGVTRTVPATVETTGFGGALNDLRATENLAGVGQDPRLTRAAQAHADHMAQAGYFSHRSPGGPNGDTLIARITNAGCNAGAMSENIAQGQRSEAEVLAAWVASPGHRKNMLGPRYRSYGLGRSGDIWVLNFSDGC